MGILTFSYFDALVLVQYFLFYPGKDAPVRIVRKRKESKKKMVENILTRGHHAFLRVS